MIREWLTYLRTRSRPEARKLGYVHEAIAIRERHARNRAAWKPHLSKCHETILRAAKQCADTKNCIILGSGLLLDVPLESLVEKFESVHLVDIIHLPEIRNRVKGFANVHLIEADVTGLAMALTDKSTTFDHKLPTPVPATDLLANKADLCVSLNLLSQLPLNLISAANKHYDFPDAALHDWRHVIQQSHWLWLRSLAKTVCVITDIRHITRSTGNTTTHEETVCDLPTAPAADTSWIWHLAPAGEIARGQATEAEVKAWILSV